MTILLFIVAAFMVLGCLASISMIGKPREPLTPGGAIFGLVLNTFFIVIIVIAALHYHS